MSFIAEIDPSPPSIISGLQRLYQWVLNNFLLVSSVFENFGVIYVADGSTPQTGIGTTPEVLENFTTNGVSKGVILEFSHYPVFGS